MVAAAADTGIAGFRLPVHHRQVNERWLDGLRPWVYGAGFGWQIGTGVVTYIKTAAVYLLIVLAALTALAPPGAGARGPVRAGAGPGRLPRTGHHEPGRPGGIPPALHGLGPVALGIAIACELAVGLVLAASLSPWAGVAVVAVVAAGAGMAMRHGIPSVWRLVAVATPRLRVRPARRD